MPSSYTCLHYHVIFGTKNRVPQIALHPTIAVSDLVRNITGAFHFKRNSLCFWTVMESHTMNAIFGREMPAGVVFGRPSGALSDVSPSDRGLAPPANGGRPCGAGNHHAESATDAARILLTHGFGLWLLEER